MSKKFINPNWKALRKVSEKLQRCFFYCWDKADAAGVYELDTAYMQADLGFSVSFDELLKLPLVKNIGAERLLFEDYLDVQTGGILKDGYNPHKPIFRAIDFHGSEFFLDLDLKIETGVKDNKKIQAIKSFFKLKNKTTELVDEGEDEKEKEKEDGGRGEKEGGTEGGAPVVPMHEEKLVPQLLKIFKTKFPNYHEEQEKDFPALLAIAYKIGKSLTLSKHDVLTKPGSEAVKKRWGDLLEIMASDRWYSGKSLFKLNQDWQDFIQFSNSQNGNNSKNTGGSKPRAQAVGAGGFGSL